MKSIRYIPAVLLSLLLGACGNHVGNARPKTIYLQPLNSFTEAEAQQVADELAAYFVEDSILTDFEIVVLPNMQLPDSCKSKSRPRYRADKILSLFRKGNTFPIMGLIHDDISTTTRNVDDWGVMGLSSTQGKKVGVSSTYRVKDKKLYWKVVAHEFIHNYYNYGHCPDDNIHCIMKDAKKHPRLSEQEGLCETCRMRIFSK